MNLRFLLKKKKYGPFLVLLLLLISLWIKQNAPHTAENSALLTAIESRASGTQVSGSGVVTAILRDDTKGSRHQRFIVSIPTGQTVLIAHNIDLAPRIDSLRMGDEVGFYGEYEWNNKGGVIHWTHKDPKGHHVAGWLKHHSTIYQ